MSRVRVGDLFRSTVSVSGAALILDRRLAKRAGVA